MKLISILRCHRYGPVVIAYVDGECSDVDRFLHDEILELQPNKKSKSSDEARSVILDRFLA